MGDVAAVMRVSTLSAASTLSVSEIFGPTLQGEGPYAGRLASFIRLGGCNLSCSWCDTPHTWDGSRFDLRAELTPTEPAGIAAQVSTPLVVLTGGEPLIHQQSPGWSALLDALYADCREVHVETNGTRAPAKVTRDRVAVFVVSPKLANAGVHRGHQDPTLHPVWPDMARSGREVHLKVVCADAADVRSTAEMAGRLDWPRERVWVMPLGANRLDLAATWPAVAEAAAKAGINATHRLHVLAWGSERGR